ncbi:MAG TPA: 3-phosphoshikimate 1-carboxyvinyltransferase [Solirubrobacterales bacterium]|nr:3-phosphoshikimate 1-carboxyvinyltransferase [Solirubrobacterales bacterium]
MDRRVDAHFAPAGSLTGHLLAPPDKSISHRAALLGAFGEGVAQIAGYLDSADTRSSLAVMEVLGAAIEVIPGDRDGVLDVAIEGFGLGGARAPSEAIDVGNAGTLIRLLVGLLAGQEGRSFRLDGDESIRARPMARVAEPLRDMGAAVETAAGGRPPLLVTGRPLHAIHHEMQVASAQVKSCLLLAGLLASGHTTVREPAATRDHTERMLRAAGADVRVERERPSLPGDPVAATIGIAPAERISLPPMRVPGDLSSAAFHLAAALLVAGADVTIAGVGLNPTRIGLLGILNRMGADVEVVEEGHEGGEPAGSVRARHGHLTAALVGAAEVPAAIDELPLVGLLGCFAEGTTRVRGAAELRHKESDRIAGTVAAINALGGEAEALEDGFTVTGTGGLRGGEIDARGDHRLAMLGAVAGLASRDGVTVRDFGAARISYPGFERDLRSLLNGRTAGA